MWVGHIVFMSGYFNYQKNLCVLCCHFIWRWRKNVEKYLNLLPNFFWLFFITSSFTCLVLNKLKNPCLGGCHHRRRTWYIISCSFSTLMKEFGFYILLLKYLYVYHLCISLSTIGLKIICKLRFNIP